MNEKVAMATDRTPLLQTVPVAPPRQRYPHQTLRRVCTYILTGACIAALGVLVFLFFATDSGDRLSPNQPWLPSNAWPDSEGIGYNDLQEILLSTPKESRMRKYNKYYTSGPHLAGKNKTQAQWTRDRWQELGVKNSELVSYDVYINYPREHRLALIETKSNGDHKVKFEAALEEDVLKEDRTSGLKDRIPTFHGYSTTGNVTAPYVFCNYGTFRDFEDLQKANVSLEGKIALVKYGLVFRGLKVKRAQELGMIGTIIYSDPGDDGVMTEEEGEEQYPYGPARQASSVQRGSVQFLGFAAGDPTTPGYPSKPGVPRQNTKYAIPHIPSLPISYAEAIPLLKALHGYGPKASSFNKWWQTGGLGYKGVEYNIGPSPDNLVINLNNQQKYEITPIWNVIGIINGTVPDEVVVIGNHRDAWIAGGAADPNSGSAAFNEVVRGFGKALEAGWKPLRTIILASWDGEEYGLLGSTEWVEDYVPWLKKAGVAYVNVDVAVSGPYFSAAAAPLLDSALIRSTSMVKSPNQTTKGQTVLDTWSKPIRSMGSGSDFTAFQDFAGIPCIDMGFKYGGDSPVYHYHSNYDSFDWMDRFGDPGWHYHAAMAKMWGVLVADLVESPIIPFNATNYGRAFKWYRDDLQRKISESDLADQGLTLDELSSAIDSFVDASIKFDAKVKHIQKNLKAVKDLPWYKTWRKVRLFSKARDINKRYKAIEQQFLYSPGLDKRTWYKHSVFAPGRWTGYSGAIWPGLVESLEDSDVGNFYRWEGIISDQVKKAVKLLEI